MPEKRVKLTPSQEELYFKIVEVYKGLFEGFNALAEANMTMRLERMAEEQGIDLHEEKWSFDHKTREFVKVEEPEVAPEEFPEAEVVNPTEEEVHKSVVVQVECIGAGGSVADGN